MADDQVISVDRLVKRYGTLTAVDSVSFAVERGEIFGLLGPNGAGKTTIISILSCLIPPTSGTASICGFDVVRDSLEVRSRIGVVPQEIALYQSLSARDNLIFWGKMYGVTGAALKARVDELLDVVQLTDRAGQRIDTFSGGMKRRINIAVGLIHRPEVLFLDEPTVGIDPQTRRSILDLAKELNAQGLTIVYTTHYLEEAEYLCDRVGVANEGRLVAIGTKQELVDSIGEPDYILVRAAGLSDAIVAAVGALPNAAGAALDEGELRVEVTSGSTVLPSLVGELARGGVEVQSIDVVTPTLETVFLRLTGRSLRDDETDSSERP